MRSADRLEYTLYLEIYTPSSWKVSARWR